MNSSWENTHLDTHTQTQLVLLLAWGWDQGTVVPYGKQKLGSTPGFLSLGIL